MEDLMIVKEIKYRSLPLGEGEGGRGQSDE